MSESPTAGAPSEPPTAGRPHQQFTAGQQPLAGDGNPRDRQRPPRHAALGSRLPDYRRPADRTDSAGGDRLSSGDAERRDTSSGGTSSGGEEAYRQPARHGPGRLLSTAATARAADPPAPRHPVSKAQVTATTSGVVQHWLRCFDALPANLPVAPDTRCPALAWAASGAMALTGAADGPPDVSPAHAYALLRTALHTLGDLTASQGHRVVLDPATALGLRAAWAGHQRAGRLSAGGATRLIPTADAWCAITLSRPDDIGSVPAIVGDDRPGDPWDALARAARSMTAAELAERAQLLGVPGAALPIDPAAAPIPWRMTRIAAPAPVTGLTGKLVVDLTSMWAGPLTARVLGLAGARVVKVESPHRPDGARADPRFFDWLHHGHEFRTVDFRTAAGRTELADLLDRADIVLEASRPRALAQYGLGPDQRAHKPGKVWLSITGYGRAEPMRVAFGDDAAVAGGLVGWTGDGPVFCGDAVADPLSGICGALAVVAAAAAGGGVLLDLSMRDTAAAFAAAPPLDHGPHPVSRTPAGWIVDCPHTGATGPVLPPRAPRPAASTGPSAPADLPGAATSGDNTSPGSTASTIPAYTRPSGATSNWSTLAPGTRPIGTRNTGPTLTSRTEPTDTTHTEPTVAPDAEPGGVANADSRFSGAPAGSGGTDPPDRAGAGDHGTSDGPLRHHGYRTMLIRNATVFGSDCTDVRWHGDRIVECGTGLHPIPGEDDIDARGGWLLPGFHDHHIHLRALAAQQDSVPAGPPHVHTSAEFAATLRRADSELAPGRWLRAVGYHESVAGPLDRQTLDHLVPGRPVRVQHRTGALWVLNSAACRAAGVADCALDGVERDDTGRPTGRLWRMDSWLGTRAPATVYDLGSISAAAAAAGITGYTDATPDLTQPDIDDFAQLVANSTIHQHLRCMAPPGIVAPDVGRFTVGATKFLLDDTTLPDLGDFAGRIRATHTEGRPVAVHCVTRVQLALTMAALDTAGVLPGDRIEHGALISPDIMTWLRDRGVTVVTQPHFPVERAQQYTAEIAAADRPDLWRLGSLLNTGVPVAAGTDAPFGDPDPWRVVRAAAGPRPGSDSTEELSLVQAISLFLGRAGRPAVARTVAPGSAADLVLLRVPPPEIDLPDRSLVAATIVAGRPVHYAPDA